jgi:iron complex transport system permease protein
VLATVPEEIKLRRNKSLIFLVLFILLILIFILDIVLGSVSIRPVDIFRAFFERTDSEIETIIFKFRLPKALTALAAGIALSLSGLQMQTLFRNPMAGPYVLGVSSGASLGVALVILGFSAQFVPGSFPRLGNWILVVSAWIGAGAVMMLIMFLSAVYRQS